MHNLSQVHDHSAHGLTHQVDMLLLSRSKSLSSHVLFRSITCRCSCVPSCKRIKYQNYKARAILLEDKVTGERSLGCWM
jgi:hypothetical protein